MELSYRLLRQARIEREYTVMKKALNKKVLSVLIAAVILLVTAFPVLAADPFKLTSSAEAKDSVVTVKIYLPQNTELGTLSFTLKYDTKLLTYVSAEYSSGDVSATNSSTAGGGDQAEQLRRAFSYRKHGPYIHSLFAAGSL